MPSSYSSNLRLELIGPGEQPTTWGNTTNNNIGTLLEAAISGAIELSQWTGGDYTLSALKGASDQARNMTLIVPATLSTTGNIKAPAVPKLYTVINKSSYDIGIQIGSTTAVNIPAGDTRIVVSDGTKFRDATTLPPATDTTIGGIIVGAGLEAEADGTLNVIPATDTTIGGVIVDPDGLSIDGAGTLSLDAATASTPGGVIVGPTLSVSSGTIDLDVLSPSPAGSYSSANVTIDGYGRVVFAEDGSGGGVTTKAIIIDQTTSEYALVALNENYNAVVSAYGSDPGYTPFLALYCNNNSGSIRGVLTAGRTDNSIPWFPLAFNVGGDIVAEFDTSGNFYPYADSAYELGSTSKRWSHVWADTATFEQITGVSPGPSLPVDLSVTSRITISVPNAGNQIALIATNPYGGDNNFIVSAFDASPGISQFIAMSCNNNAGSVRGLIVAGKEAFSPKAYIPLTFNVGGMFAAEIDTSGNFYPGSDNAFSLGKLGNRWTEVFAVNGTINTSDEALKTDITDSDLGLDFINALRPVSYKWANRQNVVVSNENYTQNQVLPTAGVRPHYGFVAQEVKTAMGTNDFAGYIEPEDGPLGLRYHEFIAPMVKAIQELSDKVDQLTADLAAHIGP